MARLTPHKLPLRSPLRDEVGDGWSNVSQNAGAFVVVWNEHRLGVDATVVVVVAGAVVVVSGATVVVVVSGAAVVVLATVVGVVATVVVVG